MVFLKKPKKTGFFRVFLVLIGFYMVFLGILAAKLGRRQVARAQYSPLAIDTNFILNEFTNF